MDFQDAFYTLYAVDIAPLNKYTMVPTISCSGAEENEQTFLFTDFHSCFIIIWIDDICFYRSYINCSGYVMSNMDLIPIAAAPECEI